METCRCELLNVLSGPMAQDYVHGHLEPTHPDGLGRRVHRCPTTPTEWVEDRDPDGYGDGVLVLRRLRR
ncbi:hypothetical protein [Egicoccus halophilus]|uniref:Uncharacterized protein n=1 Tax=Egicoccus halophilus TaxID=1670830 RepID=A0A8J3A7S0_9ACTN|nr:hypothetical protein [Egicoccus halophilus]GGI03224.1 hypothetical protein GCM10011354_03040 [Egicoccus halophilus]